MAVDTTDIQKLATSYLGGLTHVHTMLSNHPGHFESDQTVPGLVKALVEAGLAGAPEAPFKFVMFNEHASNPTKPHALRRYGLRAQALLRERWRTRVKGVPILYGFEASLLPDGKTDLTPVLASHCQLVIASRHRLPDEMEQNAVAITGLLEQAFQNASIDVIGHPARGIEELTGMDWRQIFDWAKASGTAVEVNLNNFPNPQYEAGRLHFWRQWLEMLAESGAMVFLGTDLHNKLQIGRFIQEWQTLDRADAPNTLGACILMLKSVGLGPSRVVNAEFETFLGWLKLSKEERRDI